MNTLLKTAVLAGVLLPHTAFAQNGGAAATADLLYKPSSAQTAAPPEQFAEYPQGRWRPTAAQYGVQIVENVTVPTDDGVILSATVAYPADKTTGRRAAGRFPVVVEHMPYEQFAAPVRVNTFFAEHGYISVLVRARGTGKSGGEVQFLSPREGQDGKNIIDWVARLNGSDGRVALNGCSWPGAIALGDAAAVGKNSPLKAVIAACSGLENMPRQSWLIGGMPSMSFWQFKGLGTQLVGDTPAVRRFFERFSSNVLSGKDEAYQGRYWNQRGRSALAQRIVANDVPVLLWAGWGDIVETGTLRAYSALQNAVAGRPVDAPMADGQKISPKYQLIMGGWGHGEGLDLGLSLQWLETWVKGVDTGLQHTATPMHIYESGSGRWLNLTGFPQLAATQYKLGSNGSLSHTQNRGQDSYRYAQPTEAQGRLVYETAPLTEGATLSGAISAGIYARSSNRNMVLIARLYDVAPDGTATLISRGALIGSQRALDRSRSWADRNGILLYPWQSFTGDNYLTPNRTYRFDIALAPRQWSIEPNHRLRFELSSQTPADKCPAEGLPASNDSEPCGLTAPQRQSVPGGVYTVLYGKDTPSALNPPLLPYRHFAEVHAGKLSIPWNEGMRRLDSNNKWTYPLVW